MEALLGELEADGADQRPGAEGEDQAHQSRGPRPDEGQERPEDEGEGGKRAPAERGGHDREPYPGGRAPLIKGSPGKPLHPPLTDAAIGAYTVGVAMLVFGALGGEEEQMAHGALLAISFGLLLAAPTAITGLLDWLDIPKGTPARTVATLHLIVMLSATVLFALTWLAQRPGYNDDEVTDPGPGARPDLGGRARDRREHRRRQRIRLRHPVVKRPETPVREALNPLGAEEKRPVPITRICKSA